MESEEVEETLGLAATQAGGTNTVNEQSPEGHNHKDEGDNSVPDELGTGVELGAVGKVVRLGRNKDAEARADDGDQSRGRSKSG